VALASVSLSARQLPAELAAIDPSGGRGSEYVAIRERYGAPNRSPIDLAVISKTDAAGRAADLMESGKRALTLLDDWLGPLALDRLTIVDLPWNSRLANARLRGIVTVRSRWLTTARDRSLDRELIDGLARQYWVGAMSGNKDPFANGLALFVAGRAIDTLLEGSQFHTERVFGEFLPYSLRPVALSPLARDERPRLRRYPELRDEPPGALRAARGLEVAERYLGWPALQQALAAFRRQGAANASGFAAIVSQQRGADVAWLFADPLRADAVFDYEVASLDNRQDGNQFGVRIAIGRRGSGVFARPLPIETRFADGTTLGDWWDPRQAQSTVEYVSASAAVSTAIDPDVILVLDESRSNNVKSLSRPSWNRQALRLACSWAIWLQNAMLAYTGIV
jgi:hypothetical protein